MMNIAPAICNRRQPDITVVSREYGAPDEVGSAIFSSSSSDLGIRATRYCSHCIIRAAASPTQLREIGFKYWVSRSRPSPNSASTRTLRLGLGPWAWPCAKFFSKKVLKIRGLSPFALRLALVPAPGPLRATPRENGVRRPNQCER